MKPKVSQLLAHVLPSVLTGVTVNMLLMVGIFINELDMPPHATQPPSLAFLIGLFTGMILAVDIMYLRRALRARRSSR